MTAPVLAEPGSTAEGRWDRFVQLIDAAAEAGAHALKNQWTSSPERMCARRHAPEYRDAYHRIAYPAAWHSRLAARCHAAGLQYGCAVYLAEDVAVIASDMDFLKISSFECRDPVLFDAARATGKPVIVSTGMTTEAEALGIATRLGPPDALLHCVSGYPAPLEAANLGAITVLRNRLWATTRVGYSDHSCSTLTGGLAVAAGAELLEVHFRLPDTSPDNPDYATALSPTQLRDYVDFVRLVERMLGSGEKVPQPAEAEMAKYRVSP